MNENINNELFQKIIEEIQDLKSKLHLAEEPIIADWLPRKKVMTFLGYEATQMNSLEKREKLLTSKVGKHKFYHRDSIIRLLEKCSK